MNITSPESIKVWFTQ